LSDVNCKQATGIGENWQTMNVTDIFYLFFLKKTAPIPCDWESSM